MHNIIEHRMQYKYQKYLAKNQQLQNNMIGENTDFDNLNKNKKGGKAGKKEICHNFLIFSGEHYYPAGGWKDLFDTANTLDKAKQLYEKGIKENGWAHVVDMRNNKIIYDNWPENTQSGIYQQKKKELEDVPTNRRT